MSFADNDQISCTFGENTIEGAYLTDNQAICVSPPALAESVVEVTVQVAKHNGNVSGGAHYQYSKSWECTYIFHTFTITIYTSPVSPHKASEVIEIQTPSHSLWVVGELAKFSWNPSSFVISELVNRSEIYLNLSLWIYNVKADVFAQKTVLVTNILNTGSTSVTLTESLAYKLLKSEKTLIICYPQLIISSSTSNVRLKRTISNLHLWSKVAKFGKLFAISSIKRALKVRLLCEGFAQTPPVPRRSIPPCPCTEQDARNDDRFEVDRSSDNHRMFFHSGSKICFRQASVR